MIIAVSLFYMTYMPGKSYSGALPSLTENENLLNKRLKGHVVILADKIGERNVTYPGKLAASAEYVTKALKEMGYDVSTQEYVVGGATVKNIECAIIGKSYPSEIVIVGAHYDSVIGSPGANDNASGVAALIEIARYFKDKATLRTVRFVFFVNEEPPYFHGELMGSRVYALRSRKNGENIVAMYALDTIGYYSDNPGSQKYPFVFRLLYPTTGNFIGFIGNLSSRTLLHHSLELFRENVKFPSEGVAAPGWVMGIDWSDHSSFWKEGYQAIMITDTAPFRYVHYHTSEDTFDKIDYDRMARVVAGLSILIEKISNRQ